MIAALEIFQDPGNDMKYSSTDLAWLEESVVVLNSECLLLEVFF